MTDTRQQKLDLFSEMNRYDERDADWPSDEVYVAPRRTLEHGWRKFHAARDCGAARVSFVEDTAHRPVSEKYSYHLRCWKCGYKIPETEVLFVGGDWWHEHGWRAYGRSLENLGLPEDRVVDLGPDPTQDELLHALNLSRIEREGKSLLGASFNSPRLYECDDCGQETPLTWDGKCRMHYDGEWTDRMTDTLRVLVRTTRERNGSFAHRLPNKLDPLTPGAYPGLLLWRRHDEVDCPKLVEVVQRLDDVDDGHREYVLADPMHTEQWRYSEEDLANCFWSTGMNRNDGKFEYMDDDRLADLWNRVKDR